MASKNIVYFWMKTKDHDGNDVAAFIMLVGLDPGVNPMTTIYTASAL
jgi:hypothetical protein